MKNPDNYDIWLAHEERLERMLERLPKCCDCGEPIQEEMAVYMNGNWYCDECLNYYRKEVVPYDWE